MMRAFRAKGRSLIIRRCNILLPMITLLMLSSFHPMICLGELIGEENNKNNRDDHAAVDDVVVAEEVIVSYDGTIDTMKDILSSYDHNITTIANKTNLTMNEIVLRLNETLNSVTNTTKSKLIEYKKQHEQLEGVVQDIVQRSSSSSTTTTSGSVTDDENEIKLEMDLNELNSIHNHIIEKTNESNRVTRKINAKRIQQIIAQLHELKEIVLKRKSDAEINGQKNSLRVQAYKKIIKEQEGILKPDILPKNELLKNDAMLLNIQTQIDTDSYKLEIMNSVLSIIQKYNNQYRQRFIDIVDGNKQKRMKEIEYYQSQEQEKIVERANAVSTCKENQALFNKMQMQGGEGEDYEISKSDHNNGNYNDNKCVTPMQMIQEIESSLNTYSQDYIGKFDHISSGNGAKIVYSLTSPTYNPPPTQNQYLKNMISLRQYFPSDWETLLSYITSQTFFDQCKFGWEHLQDIGFPPGIEYIDLFNDKTSKYNPNYSWKQWYLHIPSNIFQSFPFYKASFKTGSVLSSPLSSVNYASTSPPETIMKPSNTILQPGSCWPMAADGDEYGNDSKIKGFVTILLPYPMKISEITIDHISSLLVNEENRVSAPKEISIIGYRNCNYDYHHYSNCYPDGIEFDTRRPILMSKFRYDKSGPSTQTFAIGLGLQTKQDNDDTTDDGDYNHDPHDNEMQEEEEEDHDATGGCGSTADAFNSDGGGGGCDAAAYLYGNIDDDPNKKNGRNDVDDDGDYDPEEIVVRAIKVEVRGNWGKSDYTCMYRVRVHGEHQL